jgi:hypothetical protein
MVAPLLHGRNQGGIMIRIRTCATVFLLALALPASAQTHAGIRAGVGGDPGQFVFGGHVETKPLIEHLTFRPNVEVGLGHEVTSVDVNFEFAFWVPIHHHPWSFYAGAGPAAIFSHVSEGGPDRSPVGGGFNFLFGLQHRRGLFTELKVGFVDSPALKFTVGYAFQ